VCVSAPRLKIAMIMEVLNDRQKRKVPVDTHTHGLRHSEVQEDYSSKSENWRRCGLYHSSFSLEGVARKEKQSATQILSI
jgi:hypothetical protein